ncbi:lytic transglycosylase domain-containing protein [Lysobacter korlensis]|uniref:Lytic transglycosylase domain-containing protein n=1 Tax=Lysobacter korlensis TaxID=553636 RepID=A0ABV6RPG7_9GAMM
MKGSLITLAFVCLLGSAPAVAGTVYRCEAADGSRSYVSKRVPGAACSAVGRYEGARSRPAPFVAPVPESPAVGGVTSTHLVAGSPASGSVPAPASSSPAPAQPSSASTGSGKSRLVQGQVYSYVHDGVRHYTSKPPKGLANASAVRTIRYSFMETCFACGAKPGVNFGKIRLNTDAYRDEIAAAAAQYGVDEAIVRAIIHAESAYNPNALSRVGAQGLMQLMPATARRFGVSNAFDAAQNIRGGVQYLAWLLKRFNGDLTLAAAGYNAGEGAVDKYKGVPPYSETQRYVVRVAQLAERYRGAPVVR